MSDACLLLWRGWKNNSLSFAVQDNRRLSVLRRYAHFISLRISITAPMILLTSQSFSGTFESLGKIVMSSGISLGAFEIIQLAIFLGAMGAALLSASWLIHNRSRIAEENTKLRAKFADLSLIAQRNEILFNLKDQCIIIWNAREGEPEVLGSLSNESGAPQNKEDFLAFGAWLHLESVEALEAAIITLRQKAQSFDLIVETKKNIPLNVKGHTSGSYAIIRFVNLDGIQAEHALLKVKNRHCFETLTAFRGLLNALDQSVWTRDAMGRLDWVNDAYVRAVGANDATQVVAEGRELFDTQARYQIEHVRENQLRFTGHLSAIIQGNRHIFDVTDVTSPIGSAGCAVHISHGEQLREELQRTIRSHAETLDRLNTAVAIFDSDMKLQFFNQAFVTLWELDIAFLKTRPSHALLLDQLRSDRKLPEQSEWRCWKDSLLDAYRAIDPQEHLWHLPDTRTLRVVANPHPKGGVTWVFENLTEQFDLKSRYNTLIKVQGETLDHLTEGVVVFGADGRIRLLNPAFVSLWSLPVNLAVEGTHITAIRAVCKTFSVIDLWENFVAIVTGFVDKRDSQTGQIELATGIILSYTLVPLPKGQTMITFVDVTDSARIERALKDKNEALKRADQLKNDFVQHVSYELRSPLTNIIGFTELLQTSIFGALNERQNEYLDHISMSSSILLAIVNDILDLATVDAGIMELDISDVSVAEIAIAAADRIGNRLREHNISLKLDLSPSIHSFRGDANRVRQILFNLLSNATDYAPEGSTIILSGTRENAQAIFSVHDEGPGLPKETLDTVFKRFQTHNNGGRRRGAGLGLAIVKSFVELHGGSVEIDTGPGKGTTVMCRFPTERQKLRAAAE